MDQPVDRHAWRMLMDPARFDTAIRSLSEVGAGVPSRRTLLGVLVGGLFVTSGGDALDTAAKRRKKHKKHHRGGRGGECLADGESLPGGCSPETARTCCSSVCSDENGNCGECLGELAEMPVACDDDSEGLCCSGGCFTDVAGPWCV
jgi:hypothetical protein